MSNKFDNVLKNYITEVTAADTIATNNQLKTGLTALARSNPQIAQTLKGLSDVQQDATQAAQPANPQDYTDILKRLANPEDKSIEKLSPEHTQDEGFKSYLKNLGLQPYQDQQKAQEDQQEKETSKQVQTGSTPNTSKSAEGTVAGGTTYNPTA